MKYLVFLILLFFTRLSYSVERTDAFVIRIYEDKFKVVSPKKYDPKMNLIIENMTLVKIIGRVETLSGKVIENVAIKSSKFKSVELKVGKEDSVVFTPLVPAAQSIQLEYNRKPYEIPPKK